MGHGVPGPYGHPDLQSASTDTSEPVGRFVRSLGQPVSVLDLGRGGAAESQRLGRKAGRHDHVRQARRRRRRLRAGIARGEGIAFNIDYQSGVVSVEDEMNDLAAQAKRVGINVSLTTHPFDIVIGSAVACQPSQSTCKWTAQDWGAGWIYGPDYLPSGETLFTPGAVANYGSYGDPKATRLIDETLTAPASAEKQLLTAYAKYLAGSLPVVYQPTEIGTFGGYATTRGQALGWLRGERPGLSDAGGRYFTR